MFGFKHITPKTKILLLGFILIVLPGAIIGYVSLESINQKEENLKVKYKGTVGLVRDKLESEVFQAEASLRNSAIELFSKPNNDTDLKDWLRKIESENLAFSNLFLINTDEGLISSTVSLGWNIVQEHKPLLNPKATSDFYKAEKAEFISKDYVAAITHYKKALMKTKSVQDNALLLSRIGRCYFKSGDHKTGIKEYKKMLELGDEDITMGKIPIPIIALFQISVGYKALNDENEQYNILLELYHQLLDNPWDLLGGEYLFYLKSAREEIRKLEVLRIKTDTVERNSKDLMKRQNKLLEKIRFIEHIHKQILPNVASEVRKGVPIELQSLDIYWKEHDSTIELGFFKFPESFQHSGLLVLGYQFKKDYILSNLFPEILNSVELGKDVSVGILSDKDSLLYIQQNRPLSNYLVIGNFTQLFANWKVALFDKDGKTIEQIVGKERRLYKILFAGIIFVMLIGLVMIVRAVIHEIEASRMKSEFVSNVSHEFKTPLALIRMFGETLDSGLVTDEKKRKEFYKIIKRESERLTHLIDDVLDFSKMDTGVKKYYFEEADIVNIIRSSLEAYKFHIRDNGFEIESELPNEKILVTVDRDAISQAILNLLSNAVKYSKEKKNIHVKVYRYSELVMISVTDYGIGIAKEHIKKIFDKFYRVESAERKERGGNGLGLTLTKHIIDAHGGTIEVDSELNKGSRFTIILPLNKVKDR